MAPTTAPDIAPGSTVHVRITRNPTNAAAAKTLVRLLCKDPEAQRQMKLQRKIRDKHYKPDVRGGRLYGGRVVKQSPVKGVEGESGTFQATPDVIRDLASVSRFVEIKPA